MPQDSVQFKLAEHKKIPAGFQLKNMGSIHDNPQDFRQGLTTGRSLTTYYKSPDEFQAYGVSSTIEAQLISNFPDYENRKMLSGILGEKPSSQMARVTLLFSSTYEGYEKAEGQSQWATVGNSQDPDKRRVSHKVIEALGKHFTALGYRTEAHGIGFDVYVTKSQPPVLEQLAAIKDEYMKIAREYEEGKKPLGDIEPAKGNVKINPRNFEDRSHIPKPGDTLIESRERTVMGPATESLLAKKDPNKLADDIAKLAKTYFAVGKEVIPVQHDMFEDSLRQLLGAKGREI